ncbi:MAG TPA: NlpC/P60 family protein [Beijerinckiaceae bacterium]|nr:NlpC/P60 family protein [Beijerinckiaceae bacterium]
MQHDPRVTPARPDLAAAHLAGKVSADRFVEGVARRAVVPLSPLKRRPAFDAPLETEVLAGEAVTVYEEEEGWAWVQLADDGYVGWMSANALAAPDPAPTRRVTALRTFLYPGASIKAEPLGWLSMGATVAVTRMDGAFAATPLGFIYASHLAPPTEQAVDFVAVAESLIGAPYLWGGKSSLGLDCSGLVQLSLAMTGHAARRDSDMQEKELGQPLAIDQDLLRRGDLVFWKGHVGIMRDADTLLHANGHHMLVVSEPLAEARARILAKGAGPVTSIRRLNTQA